MSGHPFLKEEPSNAHHAYGLVGHQHADHSSTFEVSDYLNFDDGSEEGSPSPIIDFSQNPAFSFEAVKNSVQNEQATMTTSTMIDERSVKRIKAETGLRIAFRMKSEHEILDDGFKWRKYGKKQVKNSPNPRNYYRCSNSECKVKKRVERDREDSSYVITTYEGVHNHESPSMAYCTPHRNLGLGSSNQNPLVAPHSYSIQAAHSSS